MKEKGFLATGTVRDNRTANCPVEDNKTMKKTERGAYSCAFDRNLEVLAVRWNDNSVVTVMTNNSTVLPIVPAKRYNRKERKEISIPQPNLIHQYNKHMGGVDLHDNGIANYRIAIKGKKWWWPLFVNMIDSTVVNSWKIYQIANDSKISQLNFRSELAMSLIKNSTSSEAHFETEPDIIRLDNVGHIVVREANNARTKCRFCKSNTIYLCQKV